MIARRLSILALGALLAACAAGDAGDGPPTLTVSLTPLESPAGPASGEPFLSSDGESVYLSWLERVEGREHVLSFSRFNGNSWQAPAKIAQSDGFFVNWADFPSVSPGPDGNLWAHWLQRGGQGTYDYGVRVARSADGGSTWSEPFTPHEDGTPTEHGFVSMVTTPSGMEMLWLDGRATMGGHGADGEAMARGAMTVRYRSIASDGTAGPEMLVDGSVCDCCQTSLAATPEGMVAVYRNRTEDEIRDIYAARLVDGAWTEGVPVNADGWNIAGCPVNGPVVTTAGERVVVAWFTGANDVPKVKVAFSDDWGASFGAPIQVDEGNPGGRVDVHGLADGNALVTWVERTGGDEAAVRMRRVTPASTMSDAVTLTEGSSARSSGFPRIEAMGDGSMILAWTEVSDAGTQVQVTRVELGNE